MKPITVLVSVDSQTVVLGARQYLNLFRELVKNYNMDSIVDVLETGTMGSYIGGVVVLILPDDVYYVVKSNDDVKKIVEEHLLKGRTGTAVEYKVNRLLAGVVFLLDVLL